jgi:carbamoylphosphate synthase small subunit
MTDCVPGDGGAVRLRPGGQPAADRVRGEGIFIRNGPGDPQDCVQTIASIRWAMSAIQPP